MQYRNFIKDISSRNCLVFAQQPIMDIDNLITFILVG